MRKILSICLIVALLFTSLAAVPASGEPVFSSSLRADLAAQYEALLPDLGIRAEEWENEMNRCTDEEKVIMQYYFITTTMSALCSIDFSLLHSFAAHAAMLRETMPWTRELDEETFLCYVASYRVWKEPIVDYRPSFYEQLAGKIKGRSLAEAALLVNFWCGSQATYADTDKREASPLGMVNGGLGRCGEETNFVVNTLRSVGIPARECNVDWTTVPGGHAFVQVLIDGEWHYMGACEPDPVLDRAWCSSRFGSILMTESRTFSSIGLGEVRDNRDVIYYEGKGLYALNDISNFVETKELDLTVLDKNGEPAAGAAAKLVLVQPDSWVTVQADRLTDEAGKARFTLGKGSIGAVAFLDGEWRWEWIAQDQTEATLSFAKTPEYDEWIAFPIQYSEADTRLWQSCTEEDRTALFGEKDCDELRAENHAGDFDAERAAPYPDCETSLRNAGKNFSQLIVFLEKDNDPLRIRLVAGLTDKYCREVSAEVLEDILQGAGNVRGSLSEDDFVKGILLPVTEWGYFTPQRLPVQQMFTAEEMQAFREDPSVLVQWFAENIHGECIRPNRGENPVLTAVLKTGFCPDQYRTGMLMELARAVGIPVCQDPETGAWLSPGTDGWAPVDWLAGTGEPEAEAPAGEVLYKAAGSEPYTGLFWDIISLNSDGVFDDFCYWLVEETDEDTAIPLPAGDYMMIMEDMQAEKSGTLYFKRFTVKDGETATLSLPEK